MATETKSKEPAKYTGDPTIMNGELIRQLAAHLNGDKCDEAALKQWAAAYKEQVLGQKPGEKTEK